MSTQIINVRELLDHAADIASESRLLIQKSIDGEYVSNESAINNVCRDLSTLAVHLRAANDAMFGSGMDSSNAKPAVERAGAQRENNTLAIGEITPQETTKERKEDGAGLIHQTIPDVEGTEPRLSMVSAPPPSANDYQVSLEGAPDFDLKDFAGGVERIERRGELLIIQFTNGGRICVPGAVTYHAPERH